MMTSDSENWITIIFREKQSFCNGYFLSICCSGKMTVDRQTKESKEEMGLGCYFLLKRWMQNMCKNEVDRNSRKNAQIFRHVEYTSFNSDIVKFEDTLRLQPVP